jgi:hypothetical protein
VEVSGSPAGDGRPENPGNGHGVSRQHPRRPER